MTDSMSIPISTNDPILLLFMAEYSSTGSSVGCSVMTQMGGLVGVGGTEVQEGGDICIHITDSLRCTAETNTTL